MKMPSLETLIFNKQKLKRNEKQIKTLERGGNARLREFLEFYKIPKDGPIDFKYRTRACQYYRDLVNYVESI